MKKNLSHMFTIHSETAQHIRVWLELCWHLIKTTLPRELCEIILPRVNLLLTCCEPNILRVKCSRKKCIAISDFIMWSLIILRRRLSCWIFAHHLINSIISIESITTDIHTIWLIPPSHSWACWLVFERDEILSCSLTWRWNQPFQSFAHWKGVFSCFIMRKIADFGIDSNCWYFSHHK